MVAIQIHGPLLVFLVLNQNSARAGCTIATTTRGRAELRCRQSQADHPRNLYFAFACLLYSIWRSVDLLVQVELTGEYEHSQVITADNTLTLLKKETGIG